MSSTQYVGKAGHLAVMGELCLRGYNVAMPEIDKGDDVFVVNDDTGAMWRLQVKTSLGTQNKTSTRYQFRIKNNAISKPQTPELHFIFVLRNDKDAWRYLVMDRSVLNNYVKSGKFGSRGADYHQLYITLDNQGVATCSGTNISHHLEDWSTWPKI